jgi:hypothetical protein
MDCITICCNQTPASANGCTRRQATSIPTPMLWHSREDGGIAHIWHKYFSNSSWMHTGWGGSAVAAANGHGREDHGARRSAAQGGHHGTVVLVRCHCHHERQGVVLQGGASGLEWALGGAWDGVLNWARTATIKTLILMQISSCMYWRFSTDVVLYANWRGQTWP